jgi:hypothetical protein
MIDREPLPRFDNSGAQASECRFGQPRGAARAAGGLRYPANRRMIVVQEPANGESRPKMQQPMPAMIASLLLSAERIARPDSWRRSEWTSSRLGQCRDGILAGRQL